MSIRACVCVCVLVTQTRNFYFRCIRFSVVLTQRLLHVVPPRYSTYRKTLPQISKGSPPDKKKTCHVTTSFFLPLLSLFFFPVSSSNACAERCPAVACLSFHLLCCSCALHRLHCSAYPIIQFLHHWPYSAPTGSSISFFFFDQRKSDSLFMNNSTPPLASSYFARAAMKFYPICKGPCRMVCCNMACSKPWCNEPVWRNAYHVDQLP